MKLNIVSGRDRCKILEKIEFKETSSWKSCQVYSDGRKTVVSVYNNEMLGRGLINEILKQVKLSRDEYEKLRLKI